MNDHITKPIDPHRLVEALARWLPASPRAVAAAVQEPDSDHGVADSPTPFITAPQDTSPSPQADWLPSHLPPFDLTAALVHVAGKPALLRKLLLRLPDEFADTPERIVSSLTREDYDEARRLAHTLRGVAATLEASSLASAAGALETAIHSRQLQACEALLQDLRHSLQQAVQAAETLRALPVAAAPVVSAASAEQVQLALEQVIAAVDTNSFKARRHFAHLRSLLGGRSAEAEAEAVHAALERLDFAAASQALVQLAQRLEQHA